MGSKRERDRLARAAIWRWLRETTVDDLFQAVRRLSVVWVILAIVIGLFVLCVRQIDIPDQRSPLNSIRATATAQAMCEDEIARGQRQEC